MGGGGVGCEGAWRPARAGVSTAAAERRARCGLLAGGSSSRYTRLPTARVAWYVTWTTTRAIRPREPRARIPPALLVRARERARGARSGERPRRPPGSPDPLAAQGRAQGCALSSRSISWRSAAT